MAQKSQKACRSIYQYFSCYPLQKIDEATSDIVKRAVTEAMQSPELPAEELFTDVYTANQM